MSTLSLKKAPLRYGTVEQNFCIKIILNWLNSTILNYFIAQRGNHYYKMAQIFQSWARYFNLGQALIKRKAASRYCRVEQELLRNGVGNLLQSGQLLQQCGICLL